MKDGDKIPGLVGWEYHGQPANIKGLEIVGEGKAWVGGETAQQWSATVYEGPTGNTVFNASLETCLRHNRTRPGRFVVEEIICKHAEELAQTLSRLEREGYAGIYLLDESNLDDAVIERWRL